MPFLSFLFYELIALLVSYFITAFRRSIIFFLSPSFSFPLFRFHLHHFLLFFLLTLFPFNFFLHFQSPISIFLLFNILFSFIRRAHNPFSITELPFHPAFHLLPLNSNRSTFYFCFPVPVTFTTWWVCHKNRGYYVQDGFNTQKGIFWTGPSNTCIFLSPLMVGSFRLLQMLFLRFIFLLYVFKNRWPL